MADPTTVPGLLYRARASSLSLADGAAVASWPLDVGSVTLTQSTAGNRPTYRSSGQNGKPCVRFDGTDDWMSFALATQAQPVTIVVILDLAAGGDRQILHLGSCEAMVEAAAWTMYGGNYLTGGTPGTDPCVATWTYAGASSTVHVNGSQVIAGDAGTGGMSGTFNLGRHPGAARFMPGDVFEILIYSGAKTAAERATIHTYAQDTYGPTVSDYSGGGGGGATGTYQRYNADGSTTPLTLQGVWNGTTVVPLASAEVYTAPAGVALSGAGSLTVAAAPAKTAAVTLSGTGSLTVAATAARPAAVALSGTGTLTVAPSGGPSAVTLSGTGTLTVAAARVAAAAVVLGGTGSLTVTTGTPPVSASLVLGGTGMLTVTARRAATAAVLLSGTGALITTLAGGAAQQLNVSLWGIDRQTSTLVPLPHFTKLSVSDDGGVGSLQVEYPVFGRGYGLLARDVAADSDLEVEVWLAGRRSSALRGYLAQRQGDDVDERALVKFSGTLVGGRPDEALIEPQSTNTKKEYRASAATPGAVILQLLGQAQARGALTDVTTDFTTTLDSAGVAWSETLTASWPPVKTSVLDVLAKLRSLGLVDWHVSPSKVLRLWRFGTRGVNRATGSAAVTLRRGRNLSEASRRASARDGGTFLWADGAEGRYASADNPTALARRGRRIERSRSYGNIDDAGALLAATQRDAVGIGSGQDERSFGLTLGIGHPCPWIYFGVGDTVAVDTAGTLGSAPVAQIQLTVDVSGVSAAAVAGDLIESRTAALAARLAETQQGGVTIGTSVPDRENDTTIPNPPSGLQLSSQAYREGGQPRASLRVTWTPPTTNTDASLLDDLSGYQLQIEYASQSGRWESAGTPQLGATDAYVTTTPGTQVRVRLAALDYSDHVSGWATSASHVTAQDDIAPPTPSTPLLIMRAGVVVVDFDGRGSVGEAMPFDAVRVEVHVSAAAGFTPSRPLLAGSLALDAGASTTFWAGIPAVGGQAAIVGWPYGTTVYVRLVAVDEVGNASSASVVASIAVGRSIVDDIADDIITAAKLADGAVTTPAIAPKAVTTQNLTVAALSDNLTPNGGMEDVDAADATRPALWALFATSGATAALVRDATLTNVDSGTAAAKVSLSAASGQTHLRSAGIPVKAGDLVLLQARIKASRAVAGVRWRVYAWAQDPAVAPSSAAAVYTFPLFAPTTTYASYEQNWTVPATVGAGTDSALPIRFIQIAPSIGEVTGDSTALDLWVDEVSVRRVVGSAQIADAAIVRAKIANLAVGDGQVENLTVGKLLAGTLSAAVLLSGSIKTATSGARFEADNAGIRLYNPSGTKTVDLSAVTGAADIIGTLTTGMTGRRIRLSGTDSEIYFFPQSGETRKARIFSYVPSNYPNDVALEMRAIDSDTLGYVSRLYLLPDIVEMLVSPLGSGGDQISKASLNVQRGSVSMYSNGIIGTAPFSDSDSYNIAKAFVNDSGQFQAFTADTGGAGIRNLLDMTNSATGITAEVRNGNDRNGGFLWLGRGNAGNVYFGKKTSSRDSYIRFEDDGSISAVVYGAFVWKGLATSDGNNARFEAPLYTGLSNSRFRGAIDGGGFFNLRKQSGATDPVLDADGFTGRFVKNFVIPHPLDDPAAPDRLLVHGCTEGPDAGVEYRGEVLVVGGRAVVELPDYFEALTAVDGRTVHLTQLLDGDEEDDPEFVQLAAGRIRDGRFVVRCSRSMPTSVAWLVKAARPAAAFEVEPRRDQVDVTGTGPYLTTTARSA